MFNSSLFHYLGKLVAPQTINLYDRSHGSYPWICSFNFNVPYFQKLNICHYALKEILYLIIYF